MRRLVRCEEDDSAAILEGPGQLTQLAASGRHPRNGFDNAEQRQAKTTQQIDGVPVIEHRSRGACQGLLPIGYPFLDLGGKGVGSLTVSGGPRRIELAQAHSQGLANGRHTHGIQIQMRVAHGMHVTHGAVRRSTGLQKINFGSAVLLRPLMWFDSLDPRDPLQLTDGVYAVLLRYYFPNNANLWAWALYGNDSPKGWESAATAEDTVLSKLEWYRLGNEISERQWNDIIGMLSTQGSRLDMWDGRLALSGGHLLGVAHTSQPGGQRWVRGQDHNRGCDRPCQRAAPGLVYACHPAHPGSPQGLLKAEIWRRR